MNAAQPWHIWIDTGGTFTDAIGIDPAGEIHRCKVLSSGTLREAVIEIGPDGEIVFERAATLPSAFLEGWRLAPLGGDWEMPILNHDAERGRIRLDAPPEGILAGSPIELRSGEEAPLLAARMITTTPLNRPLPPIDMRLATTRGTNALLERRGARTVFFVTEGFEDLLVIGSQQRPDIFALDIHRPSPLPERTIGVPERLAADGRILKPLDEEPLREVVRNLHREGFRCAAVALLHGHVNPEHERRLERILSEEGFHTIARSSTVSPFQGLLRRAQTTVVDAYLGPVISGYLEAVEQGLTPTIAAGLHVMTSAGGLVRPGVFRPKDSLLSGPAGGVVGAALAGRRCGFDRVIAFDMGGTSTDVARFDGDFSYVFEHRVGGIEVGAPALAIETVAAGGGSICRVENGRPVVGPQSAGAHPGPASYGAGGPLSLTDVNILLGRLLPDRFSIPIDPSHAEERLASILNELAGVDGSAPGREELLEGLVQIADERMAEAIRGISVREGVDPAGYALVAFGGAGGQHACRVAELLSMETIIVPAEAGLLSALGLGQAAIERFAQCEVLRPLSEFKPDLEDRLEGLVTEARKAMAIDGIGPESFGGVRRIVELRYLGQDAVIEIDSTPNLDLVAEFDLRYRNLFGYLPENRGIEVVALRVVAKSRTVERGMSSRRQHRPRRSGPTLRPQRCHLGGRSIDIPCFEARDLVPGAPVEGPALIIQEHSAVLIRPNWRAEGLGDGGMIVRLKGNATAAGVHRARPHAVELELMSRRFAGIAGEMGEMLRRTAISTNIKERQDYSCTLLDDRARLVVNAPHIPVHLGAMGLCVRSLVERQPIAEGDVIITNHPAFGGSHLPDVTLAAPVHFEDRLLGYVACRAHHAELGGIHPGSMPPRARSLAEEAVVIPPILLVENGAARWERVEAVLRQGPHPTRSLEDNLADLRAMLASIARGREALVHLANRVGGDHVNRFMDELRSLAARQVRSILSNLVDGRFEGRQKLDDGSPLVGCFTIAGDRAHLSFAGSAPVHPGNLNATPAIVQSVIMYVMRLLVAADLPLNEGLLEPLEIETPSGILNPPFVDDPARCPAIVGGNVETSQRLTDTLLEALGLAACSQGTMNNVSFGNEAFGYYETVGGGAGATGAADGADGVHTHMTNTRITDPEILEHRYPVRLHRFAILRGSGGAGRRRGGDGLVREMEFLEPLSLSFLGQHRTHGPYGAAGGHAGTVGRQWIVRADGEKIEMAPIDGCDVQPGDRFVLETPGGGGWGTPEEDGS